MAYLWRLFQTGTLNSPPKSGNISALGQPEFWILSADQRPNWEAQSRARIGHRLHYNSKPSHLVLTVPTGRVHIQFTYLGTYSGGPTPHRRLAAPLCGSPLNTHSQIWTWTEGVVSSEGHSSKTLLVSALTVYSDRMRSRPFGSWFQAASIYAHPPHIPRSSPSTTAHCAVHPTPRHPAGSLTVAWPTQDCFCLFCVLCFKLN